MTRIPIHQTEKKDKLGPAGGPQRRGRRAPVGPPALLPPRQLAAELDPQSPGSSGLSLPARPAAGPLPICRPEQRECAGSRREATAGPAREKTEFPFCALRGATPGPRSRLQAAALNDFTAASDAELDAGHG